MAEPPFLSVEPPLGGFYHVLSSLCSIKIAIYWVNHLSLMVDFHKSQQSIVKSRFGCVNFKLLLDPWMVEIQLYPQFVLLKPPCFDGEIPNPFVSSMSPLPRRKFQTAAPPVTGDTGVPTKNSWDL